MKLSVLVENSVCENNHFRIKAEHGLSLYAEFGGKNILFDIGQSDLFIKNAHKLKIDLSKVDYLIISHGHLDHGGGLKHFLAINKTAKIFLHKEATNKFYTKVLGFIPFYIGLDFKIIEENLERFIFVEDDCRISDKISIIQDFPEKFPRSEMNKSLYEKKKNQLILDSFSHELCLVIEEDKGVVVFTACSHSGLPNMLRKVKGKFNDKTITAVFGGFHTHNPINKKNAKKEYIDKLMQEINVDNTTFYTGHCTGKKNYAYMKSKLGNKIKTMNSGEKITIE